MENNNVGCLIRSKVLSNNFIRNLYFLGIISVFAFVINACSQKVVESKNAEFSDRIEVMEKAGHSEEIYIGVDKMPEFKGGSQALHNYFKENVKYPEDALSNKITGRVTVQFVVEKDGSIGPVHVLKGIGHGCDQEAVRLIENMPDWEPGTHEDVAVRTWFTVPVVFGEIQTHSTQDVISTSTGAKFQQEDVFITTEVMPEYQGGFDALRSYLSENIRYPEGALENSVSGRVTVQFVVEKDGSIGPINVLKGIGHGCDEEAIRLVENMPNWEPGIQNGQAVRTWFTVPVVFNPAD